MFVNISEKLHGSMTTTLMTFKKCLRIQEIVKFCKFIGIREGFCIGWELLILNNPFHDLSNLPLPWMPKSTQNNHFRESSMFRVKGLVKP